MRNLYTVGASAVALSAALGTGAALAGPALPPRVLSVNVADYNAALLTTANAIVTVPAGIATYALNGGGRTLEINSRLTVTLPPNFTFGSQPALSDTGTTVFTLFSGGINSQSATFVVQTAPLVPGQSATLGTFAIQGATALETPIPVAEALPISMQATNNAEIDNNDLIPFTKGAFASEPGAAATFVGQIQFIDLSSPSLGTLFFASPDTPTVLFAPTAVQAETVDAATSSVQVLQPSGALNALSTADTATLTLAGLFNGIKTAFSSTTVDCLSPIATGTVTASQLTFPSIPVNQEEFLCVTATGTTLLQENVNGFPNVAVAPGTSTDFLGTNANVEFPGIISYTGGGVVNVTNFFTGDDSGYSSLLRVNNAGNGTVSLYALVQPDTGGVPLTGLLGSLGGGIGTIFTEPQVVAVVPGLVLANSGQRSTLQLIVTGDFGDVAASSILVNPAGVVTNVGLTPNEPPK